MSISSALITGASRGIGLELVRQLLKQGWHVIATCRQPTGALAAMKDEAADRLQILSDVDVSSEQGCAPLQAVRIASIELLVCNAGTLANDDFDTIDFESVNHQFNVNALGPLRTVHALRPILERGSKVVVIGSMLGTFANNKSGTRYGYRMSKCAAHMAAVSMAAEFKAAGIAVGIIHPGVVQTDMLKVSGSSAECLPEDSAAGILGAVRLLTIETTGGFWNYKGEQMAF